MITITIDTDNAAFEDNPGEVAGIFEQLMQLSIEGSWKYLNNQTIKDSNGNTVGKVTIEESI